MRELVADSRIGRHRLSSKRQGSKSKPYHFIYIEFYMHKNNNGFSWLHRGKRELVADSRVGRRRLSSKRQAAKVSSGPASSTSWLHNSGEL